MQLFGTNKLEYKEYILYLFTLSLSLYFSIGNMQIFIWYFCKIYVLTIKWNTLMAFAENWDLAL